MKLSIALCLAIIVIMTSGCVKQEQIQEQQFAAQTEPAVAGASKPLSIPIAAATSTSAPIVTKATLTAVGDVLLHNRVYEDAAQKDGSYNFRPMFDHVRVILHQSDIVVANEESNIGGKNLGLSSFPIFNSPQEIGDALLDAGFNFITVANNHIMDKGAVGIQSALAYWDKIGMPYTGAFKSQEDRDHIRTLTKNGITFAFLAYTYGTNGFIIPKDKPYLVNIIQEEQMKKDIQLAKKQADVVVVSMHWGVEDQSVPNAEQKHLAAILAEMGADIIIGSHPHVLQPFAWIQRADGSKTFVMYSMGNFLSSQDQLLELIGGIGEITVIKTKQGDTSKIELINPAFIPTYMFYENYHNYHILLLNGIDDKLLTNSKLQLLNIQAHMRKYIPELQFP
jgi:poly-gamma-glutamate capsule biosynthesis protein CapA/YwtB (metallophosphatase superfamily)